MTTISSDSRRNRIAYDAIAAGRHNDPYSLLGIHTVDNVRLVRTLQPGARSVELIDTSGDVLATAEKVHDEGIFVAEMPANKRRYLFRVTHVDGVEEVCEDVYRFGQTLGDVDLYLLGEGSDKQVYEKLGAQVREVAGVAGTRFAVWAPNASRVSVIGDFNAWDGRRHVMRRHAANGIWEIFVPGVGHGTTYKYELQAKSGRLLPLKADPFARYQEPPPGNASIVYQSDYHWNDSQWLERRDPATELKKPVSIYEVHLGSWRRHGNDGNQYLAYRELAEELVSYVSDMGYTHIELLPVTEHPFDGSWGYQPIGMFAPTQRFGEPDDFRFFIDQCHAAGIAVIVDWVPAHFPRDEHGLRRFDGSALYEHEDPRKGEHADWGTLIFDFGRREVVNYLIGNALFWIKEFHIDGIRVDAVASMLYLNYSRKDGEWSPNKHGGNENLEAVDFIRKLNVEVHAHGATSYAEESTTWPGVSRPVDAGGLGFTYKWNMGWMNDTLSYMSEETIHRKYHHHKMTFASAYAFTENFVLPLSHDEVVHGKRSLIGRMPGDEWQKFANVRAYIATMFAHPGKKLLFMGDEIAQWREWNHDASLDWHLLEQGLHNGVKRLVRDLNKLYRNTPALYEVDFDEHGFCWLDADDRDQSVYAWLRRDTHGGFVICVANMTPVVREGYRLGVPEKGEYQERLNTDSEHYGGSNVGNQLMTSESVEHHGQAESLQLTLPPLATIIIGRTK